jgi:excisionase family DNA binding protein
VNIRGYRCRYEIRGVQKAGRGVYTADAAESGVQKSVGGTYREGKGMILTVEQLAERFQLSPKTVYRALERRELRAAKLGNRWRIRLEDAERWFDEHVPQDDASTTAHKTVKIRHGSLRPLVASDREGVR